MQTTDVIYFLPENLHTNPTGKIRTNTLWRSAIFYKNVGFCPASSRKTSFLHGLFWHFSQQCFPSEIYLFMVNNCNTGSLICPYTGTSFWRLYC